MFKKLMLGCCLWGFASLEAKPWQQNVRDLHDTLMTFLRIRQLTQQGDQQSMIELIEIWIAAHNRNQQDEE
jgi:hypothetical protein